MRLHVVDGTYELFRAHYSKRPGHEGPDGTDLKATVGLIRSLQMLLEDGAEDVTHLTVAFDNPVESFRNELFDDYKTGEGMEPALYAQFDGVEQAACALGVTVWSMDRYEADDGLATAAVRFAPEVDQVRVMSPDKDLGQVVRGDAIVQVDRMRERVYNAAGVRAKMGVDPESIPDYLALVGDSADGIPGLPRFGAKGSSTLLAHYKHLEAIPDRPDEWQVEVRGAKGLAATLAERREDAMLYRRLATLVTDIEMPHALEDLAYRGTPKAVFSEWAESIGAPQLVRRVRRFSSTPDQPGKMARK